MKKKKNSLLQRTMASLLSAALVVGMISGTIPVNVLAQEYTQGQGDDMRCISEFISLPEDIKEQTVTVGTALEDLSLPDTLEAVIVRVEQPSEVPGEELEDEEKGEKEEKEPDNIVSGEVVEENGKDTETGADTETTTDTDEDVKTETDTETDTDTKTETDTETDENVKTETDTETDEDTKTEADAETDEDTKTEADTETGVTENTAGAENSGESNGENTPSDGEEEAETHTVAMPENYAENVIEVGTLENTQEEDSENTQEDSENIQEDTQEEDLENTQDIQEDVQGNQEQEERIVEERIIIEGVSWQSEPEYDENTAGTYIFTAVLPDGYGLADGVGIPEITVTVVEEEKELPQISGWHFDEEAVYPRGDLVYDAGIYSIAVAGGDPEVQVPLEDIIAIFPESVVLELTDPEEEGEQAVQEQVVSVLEWSCPEYKEDEDGLLPYSGSFFFQAKLEENEKGEEYVLAEDVEPIGVWFMFDAPATMALTASPGVITSNQEWGEQTLTAGTYTINPGVTVTVSGTLTVTSGVTINGGGKLVRSGGFTGSSTSQAEMFLVSGGTLTLEDITIDGNNVAACGRAINIESGIVNLNSNAVIQNHYNANANNSYRYAGGAIYCTGTLNINGGTIQKCKTEGTIRENYASTRAGGGIYLGGTCNMSAGSIVENFASNGGGVYLASGVGATLNLTGGTIAGNSVNGEGEGIYYSTKNSGNDGVFNIGGDANISDIIFQDNTTGELYPKITSKLNYKVTLKSKNTQEGKVLAEGSGYTLTSVDASKISMANSDLYSRLDTANNRIVLSTTDTPEAQWQEASGGEWKTGKFTTALEEVYDGGTIKLLMDVVLRRKAEITKKVTITSADTAHPRTITRMPEGNWGNITLMGNSAHLTLESVIYDGNRGYITIDSAREQSLIKVGDSASDTEATLVLGSGCTIQNGYKVSGSGIIAVYGKMTMNGGVIENCEAAGNGGAVWVSPSGVFTMNSGTIRGCKAGNGGGAVAIDGTCNLNGGSITGNTDGSADKNCAVYLRPDKSGNRLTLNGVTISGNTYSVYNDNGGSVSVAGNSTLSGSIYTTSAVTATGNGVSGLTSIHKIKMSSVSNGTVVVTGSTDTEHYQLDDSTYALMAKSGNLVAAAKYQITYNKNSGTIANESNYTSYTYGTGLTLPTPTRTGYTFGGWYTSQNFAGTKVTSISATETGNKTYYAKWTVNGYSVTYNKDGGTIANESNYTSYTYGTGLTLPTPTRTGYTFGGWYTSQNFAGTKVTSISATETGNKTYYAKWTANSYSVTYNKNSGSIANESNYTNYAYGVGLTLPTPTRTGYTFGGWYPDSSCTGTAVKTISATETGDKKFWAKWTDDIAPVIGPLSYNYQPKNLWDWLIGKESLIVTVPVTEEGSGADQIEYTVTPEGGKVQKKTAKLTRGSAQITVDADFKGTIFIICTDYDGNISSSVIVGADLNGASGVLIEDNAPEIEFQVNNGAVSTDAYITAPEIKVIVTDDKDNAVSGGIASVSYQIGDRDAVKVEGNYAASMKTRDSFVIPAKDIPMGETTLTVLVADHAGNTATSTQKIILMTDRERVEHAEGTVQSTVEEVLGENNRNDVGQDDIRRVVEEALDGADLEGVTVTVGDISKTNATTSEDGSVSVTVTIQSGEETKTLTIEETIPKLPKTDEEKADRTKGIVQSTVEDILSENNRNDVDQEDIRRAVEEALVNALDGTDLEDVTVTVGDIVKTDATTSKDGNISVTVTIQSGDETRTVTISETIPKLPKTDEEKADETKDVVQNTVEDILGENNRNDADQEDIRHAVEEALGNALDGTDLEDVTVTVGDIVKTDATTSKDGNISVTVTIQSGDETRTVIINETIPKLPRTDKEKVDEAEDIVQNTVQDVLDGNTSGNDTNTENVKDAINEALSGTDFAGADVTVEDIIKTDATANEDGSISVTITIQSGGEKKTITISLTIPAIGGGNKPDDGNKPDSGNKPDDSNRPNSGNEPADENKPSGGSQSNDGNQSEDGSKADGKNQPGKKTGKIEKEVETDGKAFETQISTPVGELADIVLTEAEKGQVEKGTDIKIILDVKEASVNVNREDKILVEATLTDNTEVQGYTLGQYLDISLYKLIGENRIDIPETAKKITVTIMVPDDLINTDATRTRVFAVVRVHGGVTEILNDLDDSEETITIETDRFSTYAIVYKDADGGAGSGQNGGAKTGSGKDSEPKTGDVTPLELYATLTMIAGFTYLLLYFADRRRGMTEETKKELVSRIVEWAKQGGKMRKPFALMAIFLLLVYYHSIGKKACVDWKEVYGE